MIPSGGDGDFWNLEQSLNVVEANNDVCLMPEIIFKHNAGIRCGEKREPTSDYPVN